VGFTPNDDAIRKLTRELRIRDLNRVGAWQCVQRAEHESRCEEHSGVADVFTGWALVTRDALIEQGRIRPSKKTGLQTTFNRVPTWYSNHCLQRHRIARPTTFLVRQAQQVVAVDSDRLTVHAQLGAQPQVERSRTQF